MKRLLAVAALAVPCFATLPSTPASAHPLGNFSVNHYAALTLHPTRIDATIAADLAELPTLQDPPPTCDEAAAALTITAGPTPLTWKITATSRTYARGAGGLRTTRLTCTLTAPAPLAGPTTVKVTNTFREGHIGWRELVAAAGAGLRLEDSPLPTMGMSDELRRYPTDLLTSPPNTREATFRTTPVPPPQANAQPPVATARPGDPSAAQTPGVNSAQAPDDAGSAHAPDDPDLAAAAPGGLDATAPGGLAAAAPGELDATAPGGLDAAALPASGPGPGTSPQGGTFLPGPLLSAERWLTDAAGGRTTTPLVGLLAVLLALVLGAAHAALPGHGKTVMAAYLAGSRGRPRDAITVGATVTATHTGGVLALGLLLTTTAGIAGETILNWLGVAAGALVTAIGTTTLITTIRRRRHPHPHTPHPEIHEHAEHHHPRERDLLRKNEVLRVHDYPHEHDHPHERDLLHTHEHDHPHEHDLLHTHEHDHPDEHDLLHTHHHPHGRDRSGEHVHSHERDLGSGQELGHTHPQGVLGIRGHHHGHHHHHGPGRWGLAGMGIAGGLVPSPTALIVLLGAAALGRTVFGILLVVAYGLGMAATLTAAGLLLVRVRDRFGDRFHLAARWRTAGPPATAALIMIVGLGLAGRALTGLA